METVTLFDGTDILAPMTESEARTRVEAIKAGIFNIGRQLLELYERDGWLALGYASWRECAQVEFGYSHTHVYRLLGTAEVERNLSPKGDYFDNQSIPETHLRPLTRLEPDEQRAVWQQAVDTAPNGKVTAAHVQAVVDEFRQPHVSHNSRNNEWYTPAPYIEAARRVMGGIDFDPATSEQANGIVQASQFYTVEDDGLIRPWAGRTWMNPPYASELIGRFANKLAEAFDKGDVPEAIVLVNNATETSWFQTLVEVASAVVFPRSRVRFWQPDGTPGAPLQGQAVIYLGGNHSAFLREFSAFGWGAHLWH